MVESETAVEHAFWKTDGHPLSIEYSLVTLDGICSTVVDAFYCAPRGGVEVGGVLFGTHSGNGIRILASRPLPCKYANGPTYTLSVEDETRLRELLDSSKADQELKGLVPVGWFHSHTRSGIFLSDEDLAIYNRHFPEPWHVSLVLQPGKLKPTKAGFFLREPDGSIRAESSYREFVVNPAPRPSSRPGRTKRDRQAAEPEPAPTQEPAPPIEPPSFALEVGSAPKRWKRLAMALGLLVVLSGAAAGVKAFWFTAQSGDAGLRVFDHNAHLRIDWNRNADIIRTALGATLEIADGQLKNTLELDGDQLRRGSVTYVRQGDNVSVRMTVHRPGAEPAEAVALFLGQPVAPATDSQSLRELEDLRAQLEHESTKSRGLQQAVRTLQRKIREKQDAEERK